MVIHKEAQKGRQGGVDEVAAGRMIAFGRRGDRGEK